MYPNEQNSKLHTLEAVLVPILSLWRNTITKVTLERKNLIQELAYSFGWLVHDHHDEKHCSRQAWCWNSHWELHLICKMEAEGERLGLAEVSEISKAHLSDTPPPARPHLLILLKQFYHVETKYSNARVYRSIPFESLQRVAISQKGQKWA